MPLTAFPFLSWVSNETTAPGKIEPNGYNKTEDYNWILYMNTVSNDHQGYSPWSD